MIVGINGFGRIGKQVYRILVKNGIRVALVNDPFIDLNYFHYLAKYDSIYGTLNDVQKGAKSILAYGCETFLSNESEPKDIKWSKYGVVYVIECSGKFKSLKKCEKHKCDRVILTCPSKDIPTFVVGVNHELIRNEKVISAASCTTNCLAPLAKLLNDNFEIVEGFVSTIHSITATQKTVDSKGPEWRSNRGCMNIIPAATGAAIATEKVIPEIKGKIGAMAYRVPVSNVSVIDFAVKLKKATNLEEIRKLIEIPTNAALGNVLGVTDENLVSSDLIGDTRSSILDYNASMQLSPTFFKFVSWYDNEYGYSCRVVDMLFYLSELDKNEENNSSM
ncbi:hypothetical protein GINT2_001480 [Glugoides intestinalis]